MEPNRTSSRTVYRPSDCETNILVPLEVVNMISQSFSPNIVRAGLLMLVSSLSSTVMAATPVTYQHTVAAYYELIPKTSKNQEYLDELHRCWATRFKPREWEKAEKGNNEFAKKRLTQESIGDIQKHISKYQPLGKLFSFSYPAFFWNLGEYDFNSQSFSVEPGGFARRGDYQEFYVSENIKYWHCFPTPLLLFLNNPKDVIPQLTIKMSPNKAERLVQTLKFRNLYPRVFFELVEVDIPYRRIMVDLKRVELYSDKTFGTKIHAVDIKIPKKVAAKPAAKPKPIDYGPTSGPLTKNQIIIVQQRLTDDGFDPGVIDGIWGKKTTLALKKWQKSKGAAPVGKIRKWERLVFFKQKL